MAVKRLDVVVYFEIGDSFGAILANITLIWKIRMTGAARRGRAKTLCGEHLLCIEEKLRRFDDFMKVLRQKFRI
jgi:hypothetical protein